LMNKNAAMTPCQEQPLSQNYKSQESTILCWFCGDCRCPSKAFRVVPTIFFASSF